MFKKLRSFFRKAKAEDKEKTLSTAAVILHVGIDGEIYLDIQMRDTEEETLKDLIELLKFFNPVGFIQINNVLKTSVTPELHTNILSRFMDEVGADYFSDTVSTNIKQQPCISPSEML